MISKIVCIGWNYKRHIAELNSELPTEPTVFFKPPSCIISDGDNIVIPKGVTNVQHEVELALVIGKRCRNVSESEAMDYVSHLAVFNDVTARDMQHAARDAGNTWCLAKGMDTFGPLSEYVSADGIDINNLDLELYVNGELKQKGNTGDMIFTPSFIVSYVSKYMTLEEGDVIATGTPEGISEIRKGDVVRAVIKGVGELTNPVL